MGRLAAFQKILLHQRAQEKTAGGTKQTGEEEIPYARLPILLKKEAF